MACYHAVQRGIQINLTTGATLADDLTTGQLAMSRPAVIQRNELKCSFLILYFGRKSFCQRLLDTYAPDPQLDIESAKGYSI